MLKRSGVKNKDMKHIQKFNSTLLEDAMNKNTNTSLRTVLVTYEGKEMKALAIGYGSGPYFVEKYYILEDTPYDTTDFDDVKEINPEEIIKNI